MKDLLTAALQDTIYEDAVDVLAAEFERVGITTLDQVHNAPVLVKVTGGADIYEVIKLLHEQALTEAYMEDADAISES